MKSQQLLAGLILIVSTSLCYASVYVGGEAGYQNMQMTVTKNSAAAVGGATILDGTDNFHLREVPVDIFIGYAYNTTSSWYLAAEASVDVNHNPITLGTVSTINGVTNDQRIRAVTRYDYHIDVLPGWYLCRGTLLYLRAGYAAAQFRQVPVDSSNNPPPFLASINQQRYLHGFNAGIGLQALVTKNWYYRVQYNHTWYQSFTAHRNDSVVNASARYQFSADKATVALVYEWDGDGFLL